MARAWEGAGQIPLGQMRRARQSACRRCAQGLVPAAVGFPLHRCPGVRRQSHLLLCDEEDDGGVSGLLSEPRRRSGAFLAP